MSGAGGGTDAARASAQVAVVDRGRVALVRRNDGSLGLPELPGWNGEAWRYPAAISSLAPVPAPLARLVTHLAPLVAHYGGRTPVALVEPREPLEAADAWWTPGDPPPAGLSAEAAAPLTAALGAGTDWPAFCLPGITQTLGATIAADDLLAARASLPLSRADDGAPDQLEQVQGWGLSSVWRNDEVVLKLTNPAWPAEARVTALLAELAPAVVPRVLSVGTVAGVGGPYLVQARVVDPPDEDEQDAPQVLERTRGALLAMAAVQRGAARCEDELVAAGVEHRSPARTASELPDLWAAAGAGLSAERRARLPELDRALRADLGELEAAPPLLVHGDLHLGNVLEDDGGRPQVIDWTDAAFAWAGVDLWMPLSRTAATPDQREELSAAYLEALGPEHEVAVRLGTRAAAAYHAISNMRVARFLPRELAGAFSGYVAWLVDKVFEEYGL